ncbi:MAG: ketoacyl-ACP synthase III, partial [Bacteroidota bacterium]
MAQFPIGQIRISGLAAAVPGQRASNQSLDLMSEKDRDLLIRTTGIETRRIAPQGLTAADLCEAPARKLLEALDWAPEEVEMLVFVTQTPDYVIPGTATQLQARLGLSTRCMALDINQGCAGYVYGLSTMAALMSAGKVGKGLLLVGDTITHTLSPKDKSTVPIFSDGGSATALEWDANASGMFFDLQSQGAGFRAIYVPEGGGRVPATQDSKEIVEAVPGIFRAGTDLAMQGLDVFNFALKEVAPNVRNLLEFAECDVDA